MARGDIAHVAKREIAEDLGKKTATKESSKLVVSSEVVEPLGLTKLLAMPPKEYEELMHFELNKFRDPTQNFEHIFQ